MTESFSKPGTVTGSRTGLTRRVFLRNGAAAGLLAGMGGAGLAQSQQSRANAGWDNQFDMQMASQGQILTNEPVLSLATLGYSQMALRRYGEIVAGGGWPLVANEVQAGQKPLQIGMVSPIVETLRQRLFISGDLVREAGLSDAFDSYVDAGVRRFQMRHGLPADGVVGEITLRAMNVRADIRLHQLQVNLERLNKIINKVADEPRFVMVNIPAAQIEAVEEGTIFQRYTAVVGKTDRQTPILDSKIHEIILNPFWTIPQSIIKKDVIPLMRANPNYLSDNNIHLFTYKGVEVAPSEIDWAGDEATKLLFRQEPGKINAMSSTKINFHNSHAVYMHDTPQQTLFNNLMRFDSSGCVRVHNIRELNLWLLRDTTDWDRARMDDVIRRRENTPIEVKNPVPLHFVYLTGWSNGADVVQFRDDIYHFDGETGIEEIESRQL